MPANPPDAATGDLSPRPMSQALTTVERDGEWMVGTVLRVGALFLVAVILPPLGMVLVLALAAVLLISTAMRNRLVFSVDEGGVRLGSATFSRPLRAIPLDEISDVRTSQVHLASYLGTGLRWLPGRLTYLTRSGPALVVEDRGGARLTVTVDDPEAFAWTIRAYLAQQGGDPLGLGKD